MKALCASGVAHVFYMEDYRNDELVSYFSEIAGVPVEKVQTESSD
jgi:deoxycytidylate deaminase